MLEAQHVHGQGIRVGIPVVGRGQTVNLSPLGTAGSTPAQRTKALTKRRPLEGGVLVKQTLAGRAGRSLRGVAPGRKAGLEIQMGAVASSHRRPG